jgi:hypothetical protein
LRVRSMYEKGEGPVNKNPLLSPPFSSRIRE